MNYHFEFCLFVSQPLDRIFNQSWKSVIADTSNLPLCVYDNCPDFGVRIF